SPCASTANRRTTPASPRRPSRRSPSTCRSTSWSACAPSPRTAATWARPGPRRAAAATASTSTPCSRRATCRRPRCGVRRRSSLLAAVLAARAALAADPPPPATVTITPIAAEYADLARLGIIDPKSGTQESLDLELAAGEAALERGDLATAAATFYAI